MHEFQTVVWMEAPRDVPSKASRPVLSGRGRPLPASWFWFSPCGSPFTPLFTHLRSDHQLPVVVAHSVPGRLNRFVRSSSRVKCVGLALFMQAWSFALRTSCRSTSTWHCTSSAYAAFAGSCILPARFDSSSCWSILRFQLSPVKPFCLNPSEAPRQSPLFPNTKRSLWTNVTLHTSWVARQNGFYWISHSMCTAPQCTKN